jgi:epoxyqueuosine reductase
MEELTQAIKHQAHWLGFDHCRMTPVTLAPHADFFVTWLAHGYAGEMSYLARDPARRRDPRLLVEEGLPPPRSLIVLAVNHHQFTLPAAIQNDPSRGLIAAYAWGDDYHEIIRPRLHALDAFIRQQTGRHTPGKCLVDTGPVLERDWAQEAGLGFLGKNCCIIHPQDGSWLLLATILVPEVLNYDTPPAFQPLMMVDAAAVSAGLPAKQSYGAWRLPVEESKTPHQPPSKLGTCGRCTRCLDACPTQAFVGPYHLNPQRCIAYWTIESRQPIPQTLRPLLGNRIFGCDICQDVCPWNQRLAERTPLLDGLFAHHERIAPALLEGFASATPYWLEPIAFRERFRRSPIWRAKRSGMLRNVCVALGNWADPCTVEPLRQALHDAERLPRGHAAWALGQVLRRHDDRRAYDALLQASGHETDPWVREEIGVGLGLV